MLKMKGILKRCYIGVFNFDENDEMFKYVCIAKYVLVGYYVVIILVLTMVLLSTFICSAPCCFEFILKQESVF